ncbi:MAG: stage III sporulation AC/AD family protein [Ruminococcus sp.]|nr:stage III sporulation AC/AD family protein [Ruminococcus sp.]
MDIVTIVIFCIAVCFVLKTLGSVNGEIKIFCAVLAAALVAAKFLESFSVISQTFTELFEQTDLDDDYLKIIFKSLGICYVTQLGCDCCRDCGENALASQLELAGKAALIITAFPLFTAAVEIIKSLLLI